MTTVTEIHITIRQDGNYYATVYLASGAEVFQSMAFKNYTDLVDVCRTAWPKAEIRSEV